MKSRLPWRSDNDGTPAMGARAGAEAAVLARVELRREIGAPGGRAHPGGAINHDQLSLPTASGAAGRRLPGIER